MHDGRLTLNQYLAMERRRNPSGSGECEPLLNDVAAACKSIARVVAQGALADALGSAGQTNVQGEVQTRLDVIANEVFLRQCEWGGYLAGMASEEMEDVYPIPDMYPRGRHLLVFDPLDGSSNVDANITIGSIFSVLRCPEDAELPGAKHFLQPGVRQVCAGYALYGPTTMLVITLGRGVQGFTLDRGVGEFVLTHPDMTIVPSTREFAINASNERFWEPPVKRYIEECLAGRGGLRGVDFNMRWVASMVAEVHRILVRGGVYMYPRGLKDPTQLGRLRLLYEAGPMAMIVEQAGGAASTGEERLLDVVPTSLHQRVPVILGSRDEVERIVRYHMEYAEGHDQPYTSPLFGNRSLFMAGST